jgi:hypothetical protein
LRRKNHRPLSSLKANHVNSRECQPPDRRKGLLQAIQGLPWAGGSAKLRPWEHREPILSPVERTPGTQRFSSAAVYPPYPRQHLLIRTSVGMGMTDTLLQVRVHNMSAFVNGFLITLLVAVFLQTAVGAYFEGLSGAASALRTMLYYWFVYVAISVAIGIVGFVVHRNHQSTSRNRRTEGR